MFGWSRNEAIGQRLDELIMPLRFRKAHHQGLQHFLNTGIGLIKSTDRACRHAQGRSEFPVEFSISPLKLGKPIYSVVSYTKSLPESGRAENSSGGGQSGNYQNEIKIAQRIQASLSPSAPIRSEHFEVTGYCLPADQVGGDYFDYFYRNEDHLDMIIADVSGHSIGPALFMVETRSAIRSQANRLGTPRKH